jgi:hypothetical protein
LEGDWPDWPRCPTCQTKRSARCPVCHSIGTEFPLADFQPTSSGDRLLLVCATCDDHMRPEWYRHCAKCGHDFGSGISTRPSRFPAIHWDPIFAWLLAGALLVVAIAAAYFVWLFG